MISTDRIEERMKALNLNPFSAAKRAGLGQDYVRDILRGKVKDPSASKLRDLAAILQCSVEYLQGMGDDLGSAPFSYEAHRDLHIARLKVEYVIKAGYHEARAGIGHRAPNDEAFSVVSYAIGKAEWLERVEHPYMGSSVIPAGSYIHVVDMDNYHTGLTEYIVAEKFTEDKTLVKRFITKLDFTVHGVAVWERMKTESMTWADLRSGHNKERIKAAGLILRSYQFFDGGYAEDEIPF